jgi:hypothetical protein
VSRLTNIDFSRFDRDEPIPELSTNGHQSSLAKWIGKTPREVAVNQSTKAGIDFTGTIDHVAGMMQEIMEEVGATVSCSSMQLSTGVTSWKRATGVGAGIVTPRTDTKALRSQTSQGHPAGILAGSRESNTGLKSFDD